MHVSRFVAEWYIPHLDGQTISDVARRLNDALAATPQRTVELVIAVEIPDDAYAFSVFAADSAELVAQVCERAGLPADRITAAVEAPC